MSKQNVQLPIEKRSRFINLILRSSISFEMCSDTFPVCSPTQELLLFLFSASSESWGHMYEPSYLVNIDICYSLGGVSRKFEFSEVYLIHLRNTIYRLERSINEQPTNNKLQEFKDVAQTSNPRLFQMSINEQFSLELCLLLFCCCDQSLWPKATPRKNGLSWLIAPEG